MGQWDWIGISAAAALLVACGDSNSDDGGGGTAASAGSSSGGTSGSTGSGGTSAGGSSAGGTSAGGTSAGGRSGAGGGTGGAGGTAGNCSPSPQTTQQANSSPPGASTDPATAFDGRCGAAPGQIFPPDAPWNQSVRDTCVDPDSQAVVEYLQANVTGGQTFRIDMGQASDAFGFNILAADDSVMHRQFVPTSNFFATACDEALVPVPAGGRLEGELGYNCTSDGDCHLLVFDTSECRLFEMWKADDPLGSFNGGCLAVWNADTVASDLRGLSCTSADAAGLPIMPMLVTPHEIQSGQINHALRFILPNDSVQRDVYVRPATHNPLTESRFGPPNSGPAGTQPPPYGVRLRLRADFDTSSLSNGARILAEALKEYGMFHADGGNVTFIASNEAFSSASWSDPDVDLGPNDLRDALQWTDFEVVSDLSDTESMQNVSCTRTPIDEF